MTWSNRSWVKCGGERVEKEPAGVEGRGRSVTEARREKGGTGGDKDGTGQGRDKDRTGKRRDKDGTGQGRDGTRTGKKKKTSEISYLYYLKGITKYLFTTITE